MTELVLLSDERKCAGSLRVYLRKGRRVFVLKRDDMAGVLYLHVPLRHAPDQATTDDPAKTSKVRRKRAKLAEATRQLPL